jgi:NADPH:quinone reductase-like Zn-dependent oxidoreductase
MRLYRVRQFGSGDGLQMAEEPSPPEPTGRQVLMRVRASSLNFRDLGALGALGPNGSAAAWVGGHGCGRLRPCRRRGALA